ncbi:hypothetical protein JCM8202v2_006386 [Rhodotorula sphaerocarpa]
MPSDAGQPRITLRPPPHRDYLQGHPGIPAYSPPSHAGSASAAPFVLPQDPLITLPHVDRPQATLSGTVEIRWSATPSANAGTPLRAKWLSVELEKIEVIPPEQEGRGRESGGGADSKFVELIGTGPSKLWEAGAGGPVNSLHPVISVSNGSLRPPASRSKKLSGLRGVFSRATSSNTGAAVTAHDDPDDDGYGIIAEGNYPFSIPLPEGLPPTVETGEAFFQGISYQIVASLAVKGPKRSLLKSAPVKSSLFVASAPVYLDKADILPAWPAYAPLLSPPLPAGLPWAPSTGPDGSSLLTGETREARIVLCPDDSSAAPHSGGGRISIGSEPDRGRGRGEAWIRATREVAAVGPGDALRLWVQVGWNGEAPIKLRKLDCVLLETITYRYPSPANPAYLVRAPPRVETLFSAQANVSLQGERDPAGFAVLDRREGELAFGLEGTVPADWRRMTVRTAKHIDISYHPKIRAVLENDEDELAIDRWPVIVANVPTKIANGIIREIGWVQGLCDRPGARTRDDGQKDGVTLDADMLSRSALRLKMYREAGATPPRVPFHITNPSEPAISPAPDLDASSFAPTGPIAGFVPSTRAEEEKLRYYEQATRTRDALQSSLRGSTYDSERRVSPGNGDWPHVAGAASTSAFGPPAVIAAAAPASPTDGFAPTDVSALDARIQHAALATVSQSQLQPLQRSLTTMAWSGSDAGTTPPPLSAPRSEYSPPLAGSSTATQLGRSLTLAEQEKARLYHHARETAQLRQEEARRASEADSPQHHHPSRAELDFEAAQQAYEARLVTEAEQERRAEEERLKAEFEAAQRARILAEEERWRVEEAKRQARARAELDEKKRRVEQALADDLKRFEEQRREEDRERAEELEQRRREDDLKRQRAEEIRRLDEEREQERLAAERQADAARRVREMQVRQEQEAAARAAAHEEAIRQRREEETRQEALYRQQQQAEHIRRQQEEAAAQQAHDSELEQLRAVQRRLLEEREQLMRALAAQQQSSGASQLTSSPPRPIPPTPAPAFPAARAPSVVSFAPSMTAANATAEAYAHAIALQSQAVGMSAEKAAYLRQLRERNSIAMSGSAPSSPPDMRDAVEGRPAYPDPRSSGQALAPLAESVVSTLLRSSAVSSSSRPIPSAPGQPTVSAPYRSAAEGKEHETSRRRAQEAGGASGTTSPDEEADLPSSYPAGADSSSTAPRNATEEKAELERYYAAKAAVEAHQSQPTGPATIPSTSSAPPLETPAYPTPLRNGGTAPPLPVELASLERASFSGSACTSDDPRDPAIAAGKRAAEASVGSSSPAVSEAVAPCVGPQAAGSPYQVWPPQTISTDPGAVRADDGLGQNGGGGGSSEFGSYGLGSFPGYESMSAQIAAHQNGM